MTAPGPHVFELAGGLDLVSSRRLEHVQIAYETFGELDAERANAILVCHALSGDAHVAAGPDRFGEERPGWWDPVVGPGKAIDTEKYFVICSNVLGGCSGTTGPGSIDPETGKPYGSTFPLVTVEDMVEVQVRLI
ncbi:MAG: alpha/beta fold hydrolase, partial [Xanthomonadales bacterium]|nr:alpha/beta fold hydrolase [Xanthomonadales bacterium]